jgi:hypothetical protein
MNSKRAQSRGLVGLAVGPADGRWEVTLDCIKTDRLVIRVLDAARSSLANDPSASALVVLEGREYHIQGKPLAMAASDSGSYKQRSDR